MTWSNLRELENILKSQGDESRRRENKVIATVNASEGKYAGGINMPMRRVTGHPNGVPIMSQPGGFFTANPVHAEEDPDEEAKALWKSLDADGDGDVSFEEFQIGMQEKLGPLCPKDRVLVDMYASFVDHHKSRIEDPDEAAKALWKSLDADGDEDVSFDEFRITCRRSLGRYVRRAKRCLTYMPHSWSTIIVQACMRRCEIAEPSSGSPDRPSGGSLSTLNCSECQIHENPNQMALIFTTSTKPEIALNERRQTQQELNGMEILRWSLSAMFSMASRRVRMRQKAVAVAAEDARNKFGDLLHLIARAWVSRVWSQDNEETKMLYAVLRDVKLLLAFELLEWPS